MKRVLNAVLGGCLLVASCAAPKKDTITIKGKVQFPDNQFNMEIVERNGFDKTIIDSCKVNADGTYQFTMKVDRPGGCAATARGGGCCHRAPRDGTAGDRAAQSDHRALRSASHARL